MELPMFLLSAATIEHSPDLLQKDVNKNKIVQLTNKKILKKKAIWVKRSIWLSNFFILA